MTAEADRSGELFDDWPEKYERWFETPIGALVKEYETRLLLDMLQPAGNETILDVGCGTGIFTFDVLAAGAAVVGMDISEPMIGFAANRFRSQKFTSLTGDMSHFPFTANSFDKVYSMTAVEFVSDARQVISELERVTRPGGTIVLTTLNGLSPWAEKRLEKAKQGHELFQLMTFRTPAELRRLVPDSAVLKTAIHFRKEEDPVQARRAEVEGDADGRETGAFLAACWTNK